MIYFLVFVTVLSAILNIIVALLVRELARREIPHRYTIIDQDYL